MTEGMPAGFDARAMLPLVTPRLRLRDFTEGDFDAVHGYASDPRVTATLCWGPNSEGQTRAFLAAVAMEAESEPRVSYSLGIEASSAGEIIGGIGLRPRGEETAVFELGYCLRPDHWGDGLASEAVAAMTDFGFECLGARQLVAEVFLANRASARVLEKPGFRPGRIFERHVACRNERHEARLFRLAREDWRRKTAC